jgi:hypothetical protein
LDILEVAERPVGGVRIVIVEETTLDSFIPLLYATALIVVVFDTVNPDPVYDVPLVSVGKLPSVV